MWRLLFLLLIISSCNSFQNGEELAKNYCSSCHTYPEPSLLPKSVWRDGVLPEMGLILGVVDLEEHLEKKGKISDLEKSLIRKIYGGQQHISKSDWKKITDFYFKEAPDTLGSIRQLEIKSDLDDLFDVCLKRDSSQRCITKLVFDRNLDRLLLAEKRGMLNVLNTDFKVLDETYMQGSIADMAYINEDTLLVLKFGNMNPSNIPSGSLVQFYPKTESKLQEPIIKNLHRPVDFKKADFDNDGFEDILISNFGFQIGSLALHRGVSRYGFKEEIMSPYPGSLKLITEDFDKDGDLDFMVLTAQGKEEVSLYDNQGDGTFLQKVLIKHPPVYGTSDFVFVDINGDGIRDLVVAAGDNADYSQVLKPYHGIYIYHGDEFMNYSLSVFLPLHGATGLMADDLDKDGDEDLAVIAHFADFDNTPERGFVWIENLKKGKGYLGHTSMKASEGRWLALEGFMKNHKKGIIAGSCNLALGTNSTHFTEKERLGSLLSIKPKK
ncbi:MAG: hypothetical protein ACI9IP_001260 [Arcticibacterium sp.]|jgi:hypothetical protein